MILQKLKTQVALGKQPRVVEQLPGRYRSRPLFFYLCRTRTAYSQLQVRGGQNDPVVLRLNQDIGEDRDRGLLLHHALGETQLPHQIRLANREFHRAELLF